MSGHNKWSKIKHKKAATDAQRSRLFSKHARRITLEAKLAQGDLSSPNLLAAIERAKSDAMPKENIERALSKGAGLESTPWQSVLFETFGPGGTALLITALTDNNNRTNQAIKYTLSLHGYQLGAPGSSIWAFTKNAEGYVPHTLVSLNTTEKTILADLVEALHELDDVQDIYTTADYVV